MRILIVEEALRTARGHWPSYIGTLADGFREAGHEVDVLTHENAEDAVVARVGGTRALTRSCWEDSRSQGTVGGITHNAYYYRDVARFLRTQTKPYDFLLALTVRLQHLLALAALHRLHQGRSFERMLLLFVQGFGEYQGAGQPTAFPTSPRTKLALRALQSMRRGVEAGRVLLATETGAMRDEMERFAGLPVRLLPHPVTTGVRSENAKPSESDALTFTCPGFARHEKGTDLVQRAVLELFDERPDLPAEFVLQWLDPIGMPDGSHLRPAVDLVGHPRVRLIDRTLSPAEYDEILERTDVMLLPYRASSYYARLSRVAIEAARAGIPIVGTRHTWLEEMMRDFGAGVLHEDEDVSSIKQAIIEALRHFPELKKLAGLRSKEATAYFSPESFMDRAIHSTSG